MIMLIINYDTSRSYVEESTKHKGDCTRLTLIRYSSIRRAPTSATVGAVQLNFASGTICWRISDSRTCRTVSCSDIRSRRFCSCCATRKQCERPFNCILEVILLIYLLTFTHTKSDCAAYEGGWSVVRVREWMSIAAGRQVGHRVSIDSWQKTHYVVEDVIAIGEPLQVRQNVVVRWLIYFWLIDWLIGYLVPWMLSYDVDTCFRNDIVTCWTAANQPDVLGTLSIRRHFKAEFVRTPFPL